MLDAGEQQEHAWAWARVQARAQASDIKQKVMIGRILFPRHVPYHELIAIQCLSVDTGTFPNKLLRLHHSVIDVLIDHRLRAELAQAAKPSLMVFI